MTHITLNCKSAIVNMPGDASDKCRFQGNEWASVEMLMKTTLAVLAELIKEDASLKLAHSSVLLLSVSLVFFRLSVPHLSFLLMTQDTVLVTQK